MLTDLPYDPEARRETPLALRLKERIRREGPISVAEYMQACLQDPEHGYYRTKAAIGAKGDFITAPEISQVFGELIGLWCAVVWQQMGSPPRVNLVELGPGRGTLMRDALRAAKIVPGFREAIVVHLVESSAVLREAQLRRANDHDPTLVAHDSFATAAMSLAGTPSIVIGNEFLDTHPITQFVAVETADGLRWAERTVMLDTTGRLVFGRSVAGSRHAAPRAAMMDETVRCPASGAIAEYAFAYYEIGGPINLLASEAPTAALMMDYGSSEATALGDTVQAVRGHKFEHPLTSPGEADLTALVRFDAFAAGALDGLVPMVCDGPVTQAEFLGSLGIVERASKLMGGNPAKAAEIEMGVARLMAVPGMGSRFKAIGLRSKSLPPLPGF